MNDNTIIIGKLRRVGSGLWQQLNTNNIFKYYPSDPLYNLKTHCKNLYDELKRYNMVNYKIPFTTEESVNIRRMLESNDKDTLELCKQILLTRLNE